MTIVISKRGKRNELVSPFIKILLNGEHQLAVQGPNPAHKTVDSGPWFSRRPDSIFNVTFYTVMYITLDIEKGKA